jgi:hypothetical protein
VLRPVQALLAGSLCLVAACGRAPAASESAGQVVTSLPRGISLATRTPGGVAQLWAPRFIGVGDRWGCAEFRTEGRLTAQCWNARVPPPPWIAGLHAWRVPWLTEQGVNFEVEADRVCTVAKRGGPKRCWRPPVPGDSSRQELPVVPPSPEDPPDLAWGAVVSAQDMSCVLQQRVVLCHGPGYSPPGAPDAPVIVEFDPGPPLAESAVVPFGPSVAWQDDCLARRGCSRGPSPIPRCRPGTTSRPWADVLAEANPLVGQTVHVRGVLAVELTYDTAFDCGEGSCCDERGGVIVLSGASLPLVLGGLSCAGDDSEVCCDAPAYGQTVIATGRLEWATEGLRAWMLEQPELCE